MKRTGLRAWVLLTMVAALCVSGHSEDMPMDAVSSQEETWSSSHEEAAPYARRWYAAIGASNFHPGLRESEARIDRELNKPLGWLPFWKEPTTSRDRRNRFLLWGISFGIGRDITPRTSWMFWTGGAWGTIENKERYGLVRTDIPLSRGGAALSLEGYFYPWGKVDYASQTNARGTERAVAALANAKPYLALASGYSFVRNEATGRFKLPLVGTFFQQTEKYDHHMMQISPRIGVELPLSPRNSFTAEGGYYFFSSHRREYNGPFLTMTFRRRF